MRSNYYWTATPSSATRCRHPTVDARIFTWMAPGVCMEILSDRPRASTIGCGFVDDAAVQAERDHAIVGKLPDPSLWIPRPHRPASPGRGLPCRQRRCVTRRSGLGRSEAVADPHRRPSDVSQHEETTSLGHAMSQFRYVWRDTEPLDRRACGLAAIPVGFPCRISAQPQATAYTSWTFSGSRHSFQVLPPSRVPKTWPRRATL